MNRIHKNRPKALLAVDMIHDLLISALWKWLHIKLHRWKWMRVHITQTDSYRSRYAHRKHNEKAILTIRIDYQAAVKICFKAEAYYKSYYCVLCLDDVFWDDVLRLTQCCMWICHCSPAFVMSFMKLTAWCFFIPHTCASPVSSMSARQHRPASPDVQRRQGKIRSIQ